MNNIDKNSIAAVVVIFNPPETLYENLSALQKQVALLYLVDNSEPEYKFADKIFTSEVAKVKLLHKGSNIGVAAALNLAAKRAIKDCHSFLLCMDQDSLAADYMVENLFKYAASDVAIVAPKLVDNIKKNIAVSNTADAVLNVMTSGTLLSLKAYQKIGEFREDFFIDFIDIEYALRTAKNGYIILQANDAVLEHHVGKKIELSAKIKLTTHPAIRKYYKTRNRIYLWGEYKTDFPFFILKDICRFFLEFLRLILFEPEKIKKIDMMLKGISDAFAGKVGKFDNRRLR